MKSAKLFAAILLFISFSFANCTQDRDYRYGTDEIITSGNWGVEFYANPDKTAEFSTYSLQFNGNGKVQGTNGLNTVEGTWTVVHDVDRTDVLSISINEQNPLSELTNKWSITTKNNNALALKLKGGATEFRIRKL